jgi:D-tyrosyl-tRNA(Tyr) deacylase
MRTVIQRVSKAAVIVNQNTIAKIDYGLLILLGIENEDTQEDIEWLCAKISNLRIFNDENDIMNFSIMDINGEILLVSQFTLHASTKKGNRPSYVRAARPEVAIPLYEKFIMNMELKLEKKIQTGVFGAHMILDFVNDGPVTICMDSKNKE